MRQVQQIINNAYARQKRAQQGVDANANTELRPQLFDILGIYFGLGARVNPEFFAVQESVAWDAAIAGWRRPAAAELIYDIEDQENDEVVRVPRDDQGCEPSMKAVYRFGQAYYPVSGFSAPASSAPLIFRYSKKPDEPAELLSDIDSMWPAGHETLLALELAIYIAQKDRREEDVVYLAAQRDRQLMRLFAFLEHEDVGERRRKGRVRKFSRSSFVSVASLLAGPTSVEMPA